MRRTSILIPFFFLLTLAVPLYAQGHSSPFDVAVDTSKAGWPQVAYSPNMNIFLAVWEDYRNGEADIYGQFIETDGTLRGENFAVCSAPGHQYWPHLAFDPQYGRFLVVFEDWRDPENGDIRGVFVTSMGTIHHPPTAEADHSFLICSNPANIYTCSVAYNTKDKVYLVVWGDFRNDPTKKSYTGADVYGQLVGQMGDLLAPPSPADAAKNFVIAANPDYYESVADVAYHSVTNEFVVVYGTSAGFVFSQRVDHLGQLIAPDGNIAPSTSTGVPLQISDAFQNGPDCFQTKVEANVDLLWTKPEWCEVEIIWKGVHIPDRKDNDIWGQRVVFFKEGDKYVAKYVNLDGVVTVGRSNHSISNQKDWVGVPDIAYGGYDNEYLISWGDLRTNNFAFQDLYGQRLWVHGTEHKMTFLADDRIHTVTDTENIPYQVSADKYEGSLVGIAYGYSYNDFLLVYTFEDKKLNRKSDILGMLVRGDHTSGVTTASNTPFLFTLYPNYPNPFNAATRLRFALPSDGRVSLKIFDVMGRTVATLLDEYRTAGEYHVDWQAVDVPSGIYVALLQSGIWTRNLKLVLIK